MPPNLSSSSKHWLYTVLSCENNRVSFCRISWVVLLVSVWSKLAAGLTDFRTRRWGSASTSSKFLYSSMILLIRSCPFKDAESSIAVVIYVHFDPTNIRPILLYVWFWKCTQKHPYWKASLWIFAPKQPRIHEPWGKGSREYSTLAMLTSSIRACIFSVSHASLQQLVVRLNSSIIPQSTELYQQYTRTHRTR